MNFLVYGREGEIKSIRRIGNGSDSYKFSVFLKMELGETFPEELELAPSINGNELFDEIRKFSQKIYKEWGKFAVGGDVMQISGYLGDGSCYYRVDFIGSVINGNLD